VLFQINNVTFRSASTNLNVFFNFTRNTVPAMLSGLTLACDIVDPPRAGTPAGTVFYEFFSGSLSSDNCQLSSVSAQLRFLCDGSRAFGASSISSNLSISINGDPTENNFSSCGRTVDIPNIIGHVPAASNVCTLSAGSASSAFQLSISDLENPSPLSRYLYTFEYNFDFTVTPV